jgi:hypothetical protein
MTNRYAIFWTLSNTDVGLYVRSKLYEADYSLARAMQSFQFVEAYRWHSWQILSKFAKVLGNVEFWVRLIAAKCHSCLRPGKEFGEQRGKQVLSTTIKLRTGPIQNNYNQKNDRDCLV